MSPLNWQDAQKPPSSPTSSVSSASSASVNNPWFAVTMGLLGLIVGFAVHRFFIPTTLSAQVVSPPVVQGIVVQPSATPPPAAPAGGGCGCGGGSCGGALAPPSPTT